MLRWILPAMLVLLAPAAAPGQAIDTDIYLEPDAPLDFNLTVEPADGTEEIICFQEPLEAIEVGSVVVDRGERMAVVPISIPEMVVRCTACNQFGCSEFSPNRGVITVRQSHLFDFDNDGAINVADILGWARAVSDWIMSNGSGY